LEITPQLLTYANLLLIRARTTRLWFMMPISWEAFVSSERETFKSQSEITT